MKALLSRFRHLVLVDFEFTAPDGECPQPICLVAKDLASGQVWQLWQDDLQALSTPPYPSGEDSVLIAYYASAELGCHLALDWVLPSHILDLYVEFRNHTNGLTLPCGSGLLGALAYFGLDSIGTADKDAMRALALRGGPWSADEQAALLAYCASDVQALERLLAALAPHLDVPHALHRGRYMVAAARIEHTGIPLDGPALRRLREYWEPIQARVIERIDSAYGVYDDGHFRAARFAGFLAAQGIHWPRLPSGALDLKDDTFRDMARAYPVIAPLRELRATQSQLRLSDLAVGQDGRNRCLLSAFRARTGRNQPSNSRFIFGPAVWLRGLIQPQPGWGLAYIDWSQQEFGIAAALSKDPLMWAAYLSGDPYLSFAKQAGAVPAEATKRSHASVREQFKACVLAVQYGMGAESLARRIGQPAIYARELLALHRHTYRVFWAWSDAVLDYALLKGTVWSVFGWTLHIEANPNARSIRNFPMQANGAELLRLACCLATERGVRVCTPVHDALLIEAPLADLEAAIATTQQAMQEASEAVLGGFPLRSEVTQVGYPDRYSDARGQRMWDTVWDVIEELA